MELADSTPAPAFTGEFGYHGSIKRRPADFIGDGEGVINHAQYGKSYADSFGVNELVSLACELGPRAGNATSDIHEHAAAAAHERS